MPSIKSQIEYLIDSASQIIMGSILFLLSFSGLLCAFLLRHYNYNGWIIAGVGVLIELFALILCFLIFKGYLKKEEEPEPTEKKGKKL
ncbi:MAG: hypothetical protein ACFFDK_00730 [Promethearchaeota archaeon]